MNFLVDAQLPQRLTAWLTAAGCDALHTLDLPDANRTSDEQINDIADLYYGGGAQERHPWKQRGADLLRLAKTNGGPLVNLDGKVIGLNIARASRFATYALPAPLARQILARLKAEADKTTDEHR